MRQFIFIVIAVCSLIDILNADGLLMPVNRDYPKNFLRNRLTHVEVTIHGLVAEVAAYQEFVNEWDKPVDAVYSFPLPPDARATQFLYWYGNKVYRAVLEVREQAVNPGTGEGGIAAEVNRYIGRNGIKILLKNIPAGKIQKVKLFYVQHLDFYTGEASFSYPLATQEFVNYPLAHLQFSVSVESSAPIVGWKAPGFETCESVVENLPHRLQLEYVCPKAYPAQDFSFSYQSLQEKLNVDFYSVANDSIDGHFVLYVRPKNSAVGAEALPKRILFVISTSANMFGYKLDQCVKAVTAALDLLESFDEFNIFVYNSYVTDWRGRPVKADAANVASAKQFLGTLSSGWGSRMDEAILTALQQITDDAFNNQILVFTDGRSPLDPRFIESQNR
ncbi:MAG: VIT and VWA domain-containing protein [candidate division KSB1 bacterium]|nr:VIT and VWA domain-containing protein [candidate division KSB1 bacterium]